MLLAGIRSRWGVYIKLATLRDGSRDGQLLVVSQDGQRCIIAPPQWASMQRALDDWDNAAPVLQDAATQLSLDLSRGQVVNPNALCAPLPRAFEWLDGSAFLNHVRLARQARGATLPPSLQSDPLIYQGGSGDMLGPRDNFVLCDEAWGLDFEAEVCAVLGDIPQGIAAKDVAPHIRLLTIVNDWTMRHLVPDELAKGFGFVQSKAATGFAPFAITPDELGGAWQGGRVHVDMHCTYNGILVGSANAGVEMQFSFFDLVAHIAKTRRFCAGTLLGSGTISNADEARGYSCIAEQRAREIIASGQPKTPFMSAGDCIRIEAFVPQTLASPFGAIIQKVVAAQNDRAIV